MEQLCRYREAEKYILSIPKFTSKNDLQATRAFWEFLGRPGGCQRIIHVAGTNGKGSVCSYLNALLQEMGCSVGMFTSPHLEEMTERIKINGKNVTRAAFAEACRTVYAAVHRAQKKKKFGYHPTFFEFLFFIGMVLFEQAGTNYIILETGLGGRLDATNCINDPVMTVITRIGMDHMEYLGETIGQIAAEKAGIIKPGVPVVTPGHPKEAAAVIQERAKQTGSACYILGTDMTRDCSFHKKYIDFYYKSRYYDYIRVGLSTCALYQVENAALALYAAELLFGSALTEEKMTAAMRSAVWEGRMEEVLPHLYVDGAHNEDGVRAFLETVRCKRGQEPERDYYLLFSVVKEKNYAGMLEQIAQAKLFQKIVLTPLNSERTLSKEDLQEAAAGCGIDAEFYQSAEEALDELMKDRKKRHTVFAAGSLYLAGQVKTWARRKERHGNYD